MLPVLPLFPIAFALTDEQFRFSRTRVSLLLRAMNPRELLQENLSLVDRVIGIVCRRAQVFGADAEDFASHAKLALIENDYAILRRYEARSSLATYLSVVIQRLLVDERTRRHGRWHPSSEAQRLGPAAVVLETAVRRDRLSIDAALPHVRAIDSGVTRRDLVEMLDRLPERSGRPRMVDIDDVETSVPGGEAADARAIAADLQRVSQHAGRAFRDALSALPLEDRMLIRFRFVSSMSIADIARMMRLPQRPLYRRLEALLARLRTLLADAGIDDAVAADLIEARVEEMDFGLTNGKNNGASPSNRNEATRAGEEM